jgi:hypothetical protein
MVKSRQRLYRSQIARDLLWMREGIISEEEDLVGQLWQKQLKLGGCAQAVGVEKDAVEWAGQASDLLGSIAMYEINRSA